MLEMQNANVGTNLYEKPISKQYDEFGQTEEAIPPDAVRVELPREAGDPIRTFLSPEHSVCWNIEDLLAILQHDQSNNNGIMARLKVYTPVDGTFLPPTSEISTQSLQALIGSAKTVRESKPAFIGHGARNATAAIAGMRYNPRAAEAVASSPEMTLDFIINQTTRAIFIGSEDFCQPIPSGEGLAILPPNHDEETGATKITMAALLYDMTDKTISAKVFDRNTIENITHGQQAIIGWLGIGSDGWLTLTGSAALAEHNGNSLPCLTIDTFVPPNECNEYVLSAMRNNRMAQFILNIVSSDTPAYHSRQPRASQSISHNYNTANAIEESIPDTPEPTEEPTGQFDTENWLDLEEAESDADPEDYENQLPQKIVEGSQSYTAPVPLKPTRRRPTVPVITAPTFPLR